MPNFSFERYCNSTEIAVVLPHSERWQKGSGIGTVSVFKVLFESDGTQIPHFSEQDIQAPIAF